MKTTKQLLSFTLIFLIITSISFSPLSTTQSHAAASGAPATPALIHNNWDQDGNYTITMDIWWGNNATSWVLYENNEIVVTQTLADHTPNSQTASKSFSNKPNGIYTYKCKLINPYGTTYSNEITVTVSNSNATPTPTVTSTATPTPSDTPTPTATPTVTPTPSDTPTPTTTPTVTPTPSVTPTPTTTPTPSDTPTPTTTPTSTPVDSDTIVCTWKDNKKCAYTPTYDDTFLINSQEKVAVLHKKYKVKGTIFWNTGDAYDSLWPRLQAILDEGFLDIGAHTVTHPDLTKKTVEELSHEFATCQSLIESKTGFKCETLAYPYFQYNETVMAEASNYFISAREKGEALNPSSNIPNYYSLKSYVNYGLGNEGTLTTLEIMNGWLDAAITEGNWLIVTNHGVDGQGWEASPLSKMDSHYAYVQQKSDLVWIEGMAEVTKYIRERDQATVSVFSSTSGQITLALSDPLDDATYNFPLTLKTKVPDHWIRAEVTQDSHTYTVTPVTEDGLTFIYYDAVPDQGQITLQKIE